MTVPNKIKFSFLFLLYSLITAIASGQTTTNNDRSAMMQSYLKQYQELTNTNKNALALEVLQKYNILQEVAYAREKDSLVKSLQDDFIRNQASRRSEIERKENEIALLKSGNEDIDRENLKMTRNTLLFFGILIGAAVLVLLNRFRSLASVKDKYQLSNSYLTYMEKFASEAEADKKEASRLVVETEKASKYLEEASPLLSKITADKQHPQNKASILLLSNAQRTSHLLQPGASIEPGAKLHTDLNQLIDEVTDQSFQYYRSETSEFDCAIIRDLEKILPKIDIIPEDIRLVVFNLLMNAFDSVNEKRKQAPKGYQPKVTISTRKLPRFVQIRIKDNGLGISEKEPKVLLEPFYTNRKSEKNPGLGLAESARIINVVHKGELIIESDPGNGSDFIIRFTTLTLS